LGSGRLQHPCSTPKSSVGRSGLSCSSSVPSLHLHRTPSSTGLAASHPPSMPQPTSMPQSTSASTRPSTSRYTHLSYAELPADAYAAERACRLLYALPSLHTPMVQLVLSLLLTPSAECLQRSLVEPASDPSRSPRSGLPIPQVLLAHLAHASNGPMLPRLYAAMAAMEPVHALLFRLLAPPLFSSHDYQVGATIARGAYGTVCECWLVSPLAGAPPLAAKLIEVRRSRFRRSNLADVFSEVSTLVALRGESRAAQLYDYGTDGSSYWLVMHRYPTTLKLWARGADDVQGKVEVAGAIDEAGGIHRRPLRPLIDAYGLVIDAVRMLHRRHIAHFDLKADNFLCTPAADVDDGRVQLVVADFGVSTTSRNATDQQTPRGRGTECIKSPEMLLVANHGGQVGASLAAGAPTNENLALLGRDVGQLCDVWSIGCLFFELLTGEHLFGGDEWTAFYLRLTSETATLLTPRKVERLPAAHAPALTAFLGAVLQRQPTQRPSMDEVHTLYTKLRATIAATEALAEAPSDKGHADSATTQAQSGSLPCAPSPRGALGVADCCSDGPSARSTPTPSAFVPSSACTLYPAPCASVPSSAATLSPAAALSLGRWLPPSSSSAQYTPPPSSAQYIPEWSQLAHCGIEWLTAEVMLAPCQAARSVDALIALGVSNVVFCGVEPPATAPNGGYTSLHHVSLPAAAVADPEGAFVTVSRLLDRDATSTRATLLVSDECGASCTALATLVLQRREGLTAFEAQMRLRQICPLAHLAAGLQSPRG